MAVIGNAATRMPTKTQAGKPAARAPAASQDPPKKKFGAVRPRETRGNYLLPIDDVTAASYTLRVNRLKQKAKADKDCFKKKDTFIVEAEVTTSNNPLCPVGFAASFVAVDKGNFDYYFEDVKGVLCALLNAEPEQVDMADWSTAVGREWNDTNETGEYESEFWGDESGDQPLAGYLVNVVVKNKPKQNGEPFSMHVWTPNAEQHPELNQ